MERYPSTMRLGWLMLKRLMGIPTATADTEGQLRYTRDGDVTGAFKAFRYLAGGTYDSQEIVGTTATQTLTNKTLTAPTMADFTNANHDHLDADDGGTLTTAAIPTFTITRDSTTAFVVEDASNVDNFKIDTTGNFVQIANGTTLAGYSDNYSTETFSIASTSGNIQSDGTLSLDKGAVINNSAIDSDTQIKGDTDANLIYVDASADSVGIGTASPSHWLHLKAGTTARAPLFLPSGTNLSSAAAGAAEYDGTAFYETSDTTSGRAQTVNEQIFRLTGNGSNIGSAIADFFGANSAFPTVTNGVYELIYYVYFTKNTAGTLTWTLTNTQTYTNLVASWEGSVITGIAATGAVSSAAIVTTTTAAAALPVTGSLSNGASHFYIIRALAECGTAGNIRLRATQSAGTLTPLRGSFYVARRLFAGNVGTFAA